MFQGLELGRSTFGLALCNMFLVMKKSKELFILMVIILTTTIKSRNIDLIKDKFENRLNYFIELSNSDLYKIINELKRGIYLNF